ncbi:MAG: hypothetical protein ACR2FG_05825 [Marmoricola sp.]
MVSADFAQAAVLCPAEVGEAEFAIGAAATGPQGALYVSGELEVTARLVRWSVDLYRLTDETLAKLETLGYDAAGFALGPALPGLALVGFALYETNPELSKLLAPGLVANLQSEMYDNPWLQEALTRMAPDLVQGGAFSLSILLGPGGPLALTALSGGSWPTGDYQSSIAGLLTLAGHAGMLQDTGDFDATATGDTAPVGLASDQFLRNIYLQQQLSHDTAQVQVITVMHDGKPSYVVQIPGTQDWALKRGDNPVDLSTNIQLEAMAGSTKMQQAVADAMTKAGIKPGDPVMLTGHSQGGITAAAMVTDPNLHFNIKSVVTAGSPIGNYHIPGNVSVMSLEEKQDIVPKLDGADNPDQPNWVTVTRDLGTGSPTLPGHDLGSAHSTENYTQTGHDVDSSTAASIAAWRAANTDFFTSGDQTGSAQRYQISPTR